MSLWKRYPQDLRVSMIAATPAVKHMYPSEILYLVYMYHLVYTSHAVNQLSEQELLQLLKQSRDFNKSKSITGMLLYLQGKFIQVLEGDEMEVKKLYAGIVADPRHTRVNLIEEGHSPVRIFKDWSMGFKRLTPHDAHELGFRDIDKFFHEKEKHQDTSLLMVFLRLFYNKNITDYPEPSAGSPMTSSS